MKKIIVNCFLIIFTLPGYAQLYSRQNLSKLNQDQLNLALGQSLKAIKTAKIFTGVGAGLGITGGVLIAYGIHKSNSRTGILGGLPSTETGVGALFLIGGVITEAIAIPIWIKRSKRKSAIEVELAKYKPSGSALIIGFGMKIRF